MRAYRLMANSLDGLEQTDLADRDLGAMDVRIRVRASSLNFRDLMVLKGVLARANVPGLIPLSDGAGEIVEVGPGVTRFGVGDRVAGCFYRDWVGGNRPDPLGGDLGGTLDGMLAQEVVLPEHGVVAVPPHLSFEEAATLPCAGLTAWTAVTRLGMPLPGQTVLVQGTGGVAVFALQFSKLAGARVLATTTSAGKAAALKALGADEVIVAGEGVEWGKEARRLTRGVGVDLVVETLGDYGQTLQAVRNSGRIAVVGRRAGVPSGGLDGLIAREIRAIGVGVGSRQDFEAMNQAIEAGGVKPAIGRVFAFDEAKAAYQALEGASMVGKIAIEH